MAGMFSTVCNAPPVGVQADGTVHAAVLDNVDARTHREPCGTVRKLIRLLGSALERRAEPQDGRSRTIGHHYVIVVAGRTKRIAPFQRYILGGLGKRRIVQATKALALTDSTHER